MKSKLIALLLSLAAIGAALVFVPVAGPSPSAQAQAADCHLYGAWCSKIRNSDGTGDYLIVGHNYSDTTHAATPNVQMGASRNSWEYAAPTATNEGSPGWDDTDAYYIRICWRGHRWRIDMNETNFPIQDYGYVYHTDGVGNGWHKVSDEGPGVYWKVDGLVYIC
jgi:hypothetical protein